MNRATQEEERELTNQNGSRKAPFRTVVDAVVVLDATEFLDVCTPDELQQSGSICVVPEDQEDEIGLFYIQGEYFAVSNICKHNQRSVLHEGAVCEHVVECPLHNWRYDVRTGNSVHNKGSLKTYRVVLHEGRVLVEKPQYEAPSWTF